MVKKNKIYYGDEYYNSFKDAAKKQLESPRYCLFCGKALMLFSASAMNSMGEGGGSNTEWEYQNSHHYKCYQKHMKENGPPNEARI